MSNNVYKVTILPNGAIPTAMLSGGKEPNDDMVGRSFVSQIDMLIEEAILLKKQIRRLTRERDAYKQYVPPELLSFGSLVRHTPSPTDNGEADAGQMTDDA